MGLFYVGCVLFINSLMLLEKIDARSAAVFNLFIGILQIFTPTYLILTANNDLNTILAASALYLFGFTYLYVAITNWKGLSTSGVGYYSLWVAMMAIIFSFINFALFNDYKFSFIWINWAFLWLLFFLLLAKNMKISKFTGYIAMIQSWITCTIPALLIMTDLWNALDTTLFILLSSAVYCVFLLFYKFKMQKVVSEIRTQTQSV